MLCSARGEKLHTALLVESLPVYFCRGRGSRALLKTYRNGVLIHDASYFDAVQLEGPENLLLSMLSNVMVPPPSACSKDVFQSLLSGAIHGSAMLQHVGADSSRIVAPVTYMWRASHQKVDIDEEGLKINQSCVPLGIEASSSLRQLWVFLHASAFNEGYDALKIACHKQMNQTGISISCISREGQLAKLELIGTKAFQLLQKVLHPASSFSVDSSDMERTSVFENEDDSSSMITSLIVSDPRVFSEKMELSPEAKFSGQVGNVQEDGTEDITNRAADLLTPSLKICNFPDKLGLWDASRVVLPPVEEKVLSSEKHQKKLSFFCLGDTNLGKLNGPKDHSSTLCPIMILNGHQRESLVRSIILPLNWVKAFWIPLVSNGACAIGLRERRWIASEIGLPYFPSDFPDCNAYSCFMETEAVASDQIAKGRPPAMRPSKIPIPPPWNTVRFSLDEKLCRDAKKISEDLSAENTVNRTSSENPESGNCNIATVSPTGVSFEGCVARTSHMLNEFLNYIKGDHLLLFPIMPEKKKCIHMFMKDEGKLSWGIDRNVPLVNNGQKPCFLRVILRAYQEGVFEEGAVVCAPYISDILSWIDRSDNNDGVLQVPQSMLTSYFVEQPSGEWVLQVPNDPLIRDSHRWPIGFVTTGSVRGSKKPTSQALCEAVLLARLREEQWNAVPVKQRRKEVYVLVRNLRSTAYRLALATIVLEQQGEDVEYI